MRFMALKTAFLAAPSLLAFFLFCQAAQALDPLALAPLAEPEGRVILTVTGDMALPGGAAAARFDEAGLRALGEDTIATTTIWTDGVVTFRGVRLKSLVERLGLHGEMLNAVALNDYSAPIPFEDIERYNPLLALEMNGERLLVRDKGPVWVVYPRDDHDELKSNRINDRWVWQLTRLEAR